MFFWKNKPALTVLCVSIGVVAASVFAANSIKFKADPIQVQNFETRYRLVDTENVFTKLELDTSTGGLWQVHYSIKEGDAKGRIPINTTSLVNGADAIPGRFTLCSTNNIWNFFLLDQKDGRVWQCQWSFDKNRFIVPLKNIESGVIEEKEDKTPETGDKSPAKAP